jgi:hypothetical protein
MQRLAVAVDACIVGRDGGAERSDEDRVTTPQSLTNAVHAALVAEIGNASAEQCL